MPAPRILHAAPTVAIPGGLLRITGESLTDPEFPLTVQIGETPLRPLVASPTHLLLPIPPGASSGPLVVQVGGERGEGPPITVATLVAAGLHPVGNPAVDGAGMIYTTKSGARGEKVPLPLFRIGPTGELTPLPHEITNPTGMAVGPDGSLFVTSRNDGTLWRIPPDGEREIYARDLGIATGVVIDTAGGIIVGDRRGRILRVDGPHRTSPVATLPPSIAAYHLALGPAGELYVTAPSLSLDDPIYCVHPDGRVEHFAEWFRRPQGIACDADGSLYVVAERDEGRGIYRVTGRGETITFVVAGANLVGCALDPPRNRFLLTTTTAVYTLPWPLPSPDERAEQD